MEQRFPKPKVEGSTLSDISSNYQYLACISTRRGPATCAWVRTGVTSRAARRTAVVWRAPDTWRHPARERALLISLVAAI
jgi:hypothetical protein